MSLPSNNFDRTLTTLSGLLLGGLLGWGCGGATAPSEPNTPEPVSTAGAESSIAGSSTEAEWLEKDKKVENFEGTTNVDEFRKALTTDALDGVTHLQVSGRGWGAELAEVLAASKILDGILSLDISDNDLGTEGARTLSGAGWLTHLRELDVGGNDIRDPGVEALLAKPLDNLYSFNLSGNGIGPDGAHALTEGGKLPRVSSLDLSMNPIGAEGAKNLARGVSQHLKMLFLLGCEIGPDGAKTLAESPTSESLTLLALSGNAIEDQGVTSLAKSEHLSKLEILDLSANGVTQAGASSLAQSKGLQSLSSVDMYGNDLGEEGTAELRKRFGDNLKL